MGGSFHTIKCVYSNLQSIFSKKTEIELYLTENEVDILFFTESWIDENHDAREYQINGFQDPVVTLKTRGGSSIFVKNGFNFVELQPPLPMEDSRFISIKTKNNIDRLYACIYRSPNSTEENSFKFLRNLRWAKESYKGVVVVGDFNLPNISWSTATATSTYDNLFIDLLHVLNLSQLIEENTRFRVNQEPSLLDLIIASDADAISNITFAPPFGKSDHLTIEFKIENSYAVKNEDKYKYDFKKRDVESFRNKMQQVDWGNIFVPGADLEKAYTLFNDYVVSLFDKYAPLRGSRKINEACWSNKSVKNISKKKWDRHKC